MDIFLIAFDYEGNANVAFSTQELAEQYLIANGGDYIVKVTLDGGKSSVVDTIDLSPETQKYFQEIRDLSEKEFLEFRERWDTEIHTACGVVRSACECYAETNCGEFGGVTKKGTACFNPVLISNGERCHLHR